MTTLENGAVVFGAVEEAEVVNKRAKQVVDLTPYKAALESILVHPPLTKKFTVELTNERGHSASAVKQRFQAALTELNGNVPNVDTEKVKITYRNAYPGVMPITKMYVKWAPRDTEEKTDDKKKDKK